MQNSSPNVTNDFCDIDSETKEEIVTSLRNIYSDLTKGSTFTCDNHEDGCPARHGNVENNATQYLYVGNEVFLYNCHCNHAGLSKNGKFLLQTLNGEDAIPEGMIRNYVKPAAMSLTPDMGPSNNVVCPCFRCHQVSSIGCCCKGCMAEDDYLACSAERYYQSEGLSVKISNASCCFCNRGKQTKEENALIEGRKADNGQASDLISKLNNIEKQIKLTNENVGNITNDIDYFSSLLNELSQLVYSFKEGDRNVINTIEALKLKLMSLEKGLKCVFKDSECFQEVYQEEQISPSALSLHDEIDLKPKAVIQKEIEEDSSMADTPSEISRKFDEEPETITEAEKAADIVRQYDVQTESTSETVTPAESSQELSARIEGISEAATPPKISQSSTKFKPPTEFDRVRTDTISYTKKPASIIPHYDAQAKKIRKTVTPAEIRQQFNARTESFNEAETPPEITSQFDERLGSIRGTMKPPVHEFGTQTERIIGAGREAVTPSGFSERFDAQLENGFESVTPSESIKKDAQIKSTDKVSERNNLQADRDTINKITKKPKRDKSVGHFQPITEHIRDGLKTGTSRKLKAEHPKPMATTTVDETQTNQFVEIKEDAPDENVDQISEKREKVFKRDKPSDGIPQTDIDSSGTDTSAEKKYKFDIEAESCSQDDYQNLTDKQINGEKECCFKVKIKKVKIVGESYNFQENNKIKRKSVDTEESLNGLNKTKTSTEETPIPLLNKVSQEPGIFPKISELTEAEKSTAEKPKAEKSKAKKSKAEKSVSFADSKGIERHKITSHQKSHKNSESSKKKMAQSLGRPKESGKEFHSKQKFEIASLGRPKENGKEFHSKQKFETAKKKKQFSTNEGKYDFQKRGSLDAKQNELFTNAKGNNENGVKINVQKLSPFHFRKTKLAKRDGEKNLTKTTIEKKGSKVQSLKKGRLDSADPKDYVQQNSKANVRKKSTLNLDAARETQQNDLLNRRIYWENKHFKRTNVPNYYDSCNRDCNQYEFINQQDYCEIKNIDEQKIPTYCDQINNQENRLMNKQASCEIKNVRETSTLCDRVCFNQDSETKECKLSPGGVTFWRKVETTVTSGMCPKS